MINRQLKQSKEDLAKEDYRQECGRNVWRSGSLRAEEICPDHGSPRPGQAFGDPGDPAGAHPKRRGLPRRRALVAAAFVPAALGLLALILTVGAVQTVGAAILPGCLGFRAAVLKVRIHLPPAESQVRTCLSREFAFLRREAAISRGCTGWGERRCRQRRARSSNIALRSVVSLSSDIPVPQCRRCGSRRWGRSRGFPRLSGPGRAAWVGRDTRGAGICGRKAVISLSDAIPVPHRR